MQYDGGHPHQRVGQSTIYWTQRFQTSSEVALNMDANTDKSQEIFSNKNFNVNIMCMVDTILDDAAESNIDENWCLLDNQSTCNALINGKYLPNIKVAPDGKYLRVHCNIRLTYTNKIGDLPGY